MQTGIYQIRHVETGRLYVGQAMNFRRRWNAHRLHLNRGTHHNPHLMAAWRKYGAEQFEFEPIIICAPDNLNLYEQTALDALKPEFNWAKIAGSRRGVPQSEAAKEKNSAAHRGMKRPASHSAALRLANLGKAASPEARANMRAAKLGKKMSEEARKNMGAAQAKRDRPPEEYESRRGKKHSPEAIAKSSAARTGQKRSPEMRKRMAEAAAKMSPDKRTKIDAARRAAIAKQKR